MEDDASQRQGYGELQPQPVRVRLADVAMPAVFQRMVDHTVNQLVGCVIGQEIRRRNVRTKGSQGDVPQLYARGQARRRRDDNSPGLNRQLEFDLAGRGHHQHHAFRWLRERSCRRLHRVGVGRARQAEFRLLQCGRWRPGVTQRLWLYFGDSEKVHVSPLLRGRVFPPERPRRAVPGQFHRPVFRCGTSTYFKGRRVLVKRDLRVSSGSQRE